MKALITRKLGMTTAIDEDGIVTPMTLLSAPENTVSQIKTTETDGYQAVQICFENESKITKALAGHFKKAKVTPKVATEIRTDEELAVGDKLSVDVFSVGDKVHVTGTSKGKGWAGTIKRHNFHRGRKTHGGGSYRRPGSIGSMYPQKIFKGKKMAGQMGGETITTKNLKIVYVNPEKNLIGVTGSVPGPKKSVVLVKGAK
ncbi:MAG: 50S ribosomal protein L3 [bacterium]|nr:50S ribosomal protein L3 [bacterium]